MDLNEFFVSRKEKLLISDTLYGDSLFFFRFHYTFLCSHGQHHLLLTGFTKKATHKNFIQHLRSFMKTKHQIQFTHIPEVTSKKEEKKITDKKNQNIVIVVIIIIIFGESLLTGLKPQPDDGSPLEQSTHYPWVPNKREQIDLHIDDKQHEYLSTL